MVQHAKRLLHTSTEGLQRSRSLAEKHADFTQNCCYASTLDGSAGLPQSQDLLTAGSCRHSGSLDLVAVGQAC